MLWVALFVAFSPQAQAVPSSPCVQARIAIPAGHPIGIDHVVPTDCRSARPPAMRYDRISGILTAAVAIESGAYLGRLRLGASAAVAKGSTLTLRSASGPVVIERQVTALQPGRSGSRIFVRDEAGAVFSAPLALAEGQDLYQGGSWSAMATDRRATAVGDLITVIVAQVAEASNTTQSATRKSTDVGGSLRAGDINEGGQLAFGGGYTGRGEVRRAERLLTQLSVSIEEVMPNGDFRIIGRQNVHVNGERTLVAVRGRIRAADITSDNTILSSRIADAEIDYNGKGFVSRSARPGLINRLFSLLGLG